VGALRPRRPCGGRAPAPNWNLKLHPAILNDPDPPSCKIDSAGSILRRPFDMIDDENFHRTLF
jgi:hypothetical protein